MNLRKEQVLLLAVLGLAALQYRSIAGKTATLPGAVRPSIQDYESPELAIPPLVPATGAPKAQRDWYRQPSETQPLPPRTLAFPEPPMLPQIALPLEPAPGADHLAWLAMPGTPVEGVSLNGEGDDTAGEDGEGESEGGGGETPGAAPGLPGGDSIPDDLSKTYDRVVTSQTWYGLLQHDEETRFRLDGQRDFTSPEAPVRLQVYSRTNERMTERIMEFKVGADELNPVQDVILADTLRNRVGRSIREVATGQANIPEQEDLLTDLLRDAQQEAWVYDVALERALSLAQALPGDPRGYRWVQRIHRERGDLAAELALYDSIAEAQQAPLQAFRLQGLGQLKERLGLWEDAEADLRGAVATSPGDPQALAALANHLLQRGRASEALPLVRQAMRYVTQLEVVDRVEVHGVRVGVYMALGMREELEQALSAVPATDATWAASYLKGVGQYVLGDLDGAVNNLTDAGARTGPSESADQLPQLALAAARVRQADWAGAAAAFRGLANSAPLSRSRSLGGLALVQAMVGERSQALNTLDDALKVNPLDPWLHYMRGRCLRLSGEVDNAIEELKRCLELQDDFVAALHELAVAYADQAQANRSASSLVSAVRYIDRAVELDPLASADIVLWQGLIRFRAGELRGARQSFQWVMTNGETEQRDWAGIGLALVEYAQGRGSLARGRLDSMDSTMTAQNDLRDHVRQLIERIDDHAQKEQLWDRFERDELGRIWEVDRDGRLGPTLEDGRMVIKGTAGREGRTSAARVGALQQGGKFLAVEVDIELLPGHSSEQTFAGLEIDGRSANQGRNGIQVRFGLFDGRIGVFLEDGPNTDPDALPRPEVPDNGRSVHRLALYTQPVGDTGNALELVFQVDDVIVHRHKLSTLRPKSNQELAVRCLAQGRDGTGFAVAFDNFRLERRR